MKIIVVDKFFMEGTTAVVSDPTDRLFILHGVRSFHSASGLCAVLDNTCSSIHMKNRFAPQCNAHNTVKIKDEETCKE